jgi:hypothetical protein
MEQPLHNHQKTESKDLIGQQVDENVSSDLLDVKNKGLSYQITLSKQTSPKRRVSMNQQQRESDEVDYVRGNTQNSYEDNILSFSPVGLKKLMEKQLLSESSE